MTCVFGRTRARLTRPPILSSPITSYDVSLDGVERPTPTTLALWVRTVYKGNDNMLALGVGGAVTREEFDCARRRMRTLKSSVFDRDSAPVTSKTYARSLWFTPRRRSNYVVTVSLWRTGDSGAELRFTPGDSSTAGTLSTWTASGPPPHADTGTVIVHREGSADVSVCNTSALIADSVRRAGM